MPTPEEERALEQRRERDRAAIKEANRQRYTRMAERRRAADLLRTVKRLGG